MKIRCNRCASQFEVDDGRIPPAGLQLTCPACAAPVSAAVTAAGFAGDDDLPAPKAAGAFVASALLPAEEFADLPAAKIQAGPPAASEPLDLDDLPAPKLATAPPALDDGDLPAPKGPAFPREPTPPSLARAGDDDLPAPVGAAPTRPTNLPAPVGPMPERPNLPAPVGAAPTRPTNLPAPVGPMPERPNLPAPVGSVPARATDLPAAKAPPAPPAPPSIQRPASSSASPAAPVAAPPPLPPTAHVSAPASSPAPSIRAPLDLDVDLPPPAPAASVGDDELELVPPAGAPEPPALRAEAGPSSSTVDRASNARWGEAAWPPLDGPRSELTRASGAPPATTPREMASEPAPAAPKKPRWRLALGATVLLVASAGILAGELTPYGFFAIHLKAVRRQRREEVAARLEDARRKMELDTRSGYEAAARIYAGVADRIDDAAALQAEALFAEVISVGAPEATLHAAQAALRRADPAKTTPAVFAGAGALGALAEGSFADAAKALDSAPGRSSEPFLRVFTGWADLAAGDATKAEAELQSAASLDARDASAWYGQALDAMARGQRELVPPLLDRVLGISPDHFGARITRLALAERAAGRDDAALLAVLERSSQSAGPLELARGYVLAGRIDRDRGALDRASDAFSAAARRSPDLADAQVGLAQVECDLGQFVAAQERLQPMFDKGSRSVPVLTTLARAYLGTDHDADAQRALQPIADRVDGDPAVALAVAETEASSGDANAIDRARAHFATAIRLNPVDAGGYLGEALLYDRDGSSDQARAALADGLKASPRNPALLVARARRELAAGDDVGATSDIDGALAREASNPAALLLKARVLAGAKEYDGATKALEQLRAEAKSYPGLAEQLAALYQEQGRAKDALPLLVGALAADAHPSADLRFAVAQAYLADGQTDKALALATTILADAPLHAGAHFLIGRIELQRNQLPQSISDLRQAASGNPKPEYRLALATALEAGGHYAEALDELTAALTAAPGDAALHVEHARCLEAQARFDDAVRELEPLARETAAAAPVFELLGAAYMQRNDHRKTIDAYERAVRLAPEDAASYFYLGQAYADENLPAKAIADYETAVAKGGDGWSLAAETYYRLGVQYMAVDRRRAVDAFRKYLSVARPDDVNRRSAERQIETLGG